MLSTHTPSVGSPARGPERMISMECSVAREAAYAPATFAESLAETAFA